MDAGIRETLAALLGRDDVPAEVAAFYEQVKALHDRVFRANTPIPPFCLALVAHLGSQGGGATTYIAAPLPPVTLHAQPAWEQVGPGTAVEVDYYGQYRPATFKGLNADGRLSVAIVLNETLRETTVPPLKVRLAG